MDTVRFLDFQPQEQHQRWMESWQSWPTREVWAHPSYVSLFAEPGDRVVCASLQTESGGILYPFILRPLAKLEWASQEPGWDLTTAYGYGGPFFWGNISDTDVSAFWNQFEDWARTEHVICSFARLSVFQDQLIAFRGTVEERGPNVVRSLDLTPSELWAEYEHKVRKNVQRAQNSGLRVEIDLDGKELESFLSIYYSTMDRNQARSSYYFPKSFFETIIKDLPGQWAFFHIRKDSEIVSTELVLVSAEHIYSYLGGTLDKAFADRPNDLLKHEIIRWGIGAQKKAFVLGGGYTAGDGIFRYKKAFAPQGVLPFRVGFAVHDPHSFDGLCRRRAQWEASKGKDWAPSGQFFPAYRG